MKQKQNLNTCFRINLLHFVYFHLLLAFLIAVFASISSHFCFAWAGCEQRKRKVDCTRRKSCDIFFILSLLILSIILEGKVLMEKLYLKREDHEVVYTSNLFTSWHHLWAPDIVIGWRFLLAFSKICLFLGVW